MSEQKKKKPRIRLLKWIAILLRCGPRIVFDYFRYMLRYSRHPERYPIQKRWDALRGTALYVLKSFPMTYRIQHFERFFEFEDPTLLVSNHQSMLDILQLIGLSKRPLIFVGKESVATTPFLGRCFKLIDGYCLDRHDAKQAVRLFSKLSKQMKQEKRSAVIFPEGTRYKGEDKSKTLDFKGGSFKLAQWAKCGVLPYAEYGTFAPLSFHVKEKNYLIQMDFYEPISAEEVASKSTQELAESIQERIREELPIMQKNYEDYHAQGLHKRKWKNWIKEGIDGRLIVERKKK